MIKNLIQEIREEISITINKNPKRAILFLIIIVNLLIIIAGGVALSVLAPASLEHRGFFASLYYAFSMILDPGNVALVFEDIGEVSLTCIIVCNLLVVLGMIIFTGAIIGYITNYISESIEAANTGLRSLEISGHTVILNWNTRASEIVNDMLYTGNKERIVVLVPNRQKEIEQEIRDRIADTLEQEREQLEEAAEELKLTGAAARRYIRANTTKNRLVVIVREGDVFSTQKLNEISGSVFEGSCPIAWRMTANQERRFADAGACPSLITLLFIEQLNQIY